MPFPASPVPSYYTRLSFPTTGNNASPPCHGNFGVWYVGDTITITLSQSGATGYSVMDYWGNTVSSGSVSGTSCSPSAPSGGWKPGWYRFYLTGGSTDSLFGTSYGVTNFCVVRNNSNMVPMPGPSDTPGGLYANISDPPNGRMKSVMGFGPSRLQITQTTALTTQPDTLADVQANLTDYSTLRTGGSYVDPNRPRPLFLQFTYGSTDGVGLPATSNKWLSAYPLTGTLAATGNVYVSLGAGTSSGAKVTVYYPNSSTIVETFDNLSTTASSAAATINASSAYIRVYVPTYSSGSTPGTLAATRISNANWNGVSTVVSTLYPSIQYYEGPFNEPVLSAEIAWQTHMFKLAVHAGNSSAKAMGPCPVEIIGNLTGGNSWTTVLNEWQAIGDYPDAYAFHNYNGVNGNMMMGRNVANGFTSLLASYGQQNAPLWQTEGGDSASIPVYGVYHPNRARNALVAVLLWEQYGMPREQHLQWQDWSDDWTVPLWLTNGDSSLNPQCVLFRVLAEETYGQPHNQKISFGSYGDNLFLGSIYATPGGGTSTAVVMPVSYMPGATVTFIVTGTTNPLTIVDCLGNTNTVSINGSGQATIPVAELTYVRLPPGVSVTVYAINGIQVNGITNLATSSTATLGGSANTIINNGLFETNYVGGTGSSGIAYSSGTLPGTDAVLTWGSSITANRVAVFCAPPSQLISTLVDFDVQTSVDGTTWVTQATVTNTDCFSFRCGSDSSNAGCTHETYWREQWAFDIPIATTTFKALRLNIRQTSYGGEPDSAARAGPGGGGGGIGQGSATQQLVLQDIQVANVTAASSTGTIVNVVQGFGEKLLHF